MSVLYYLDKVNIVVDALSRMTLGSVSHIEQTNKDLVKDVHRFARFAVRLEGSPNDVLMVIIIRDIYSG